MHHVSTRVLVRFGLFVVLFLVAGAGAAQFQQYSSPEGFDEQRETMDELLERSMQEARWKVGRWFLDPWIGLSNVSYIDNVGGLGDGDDGEKQSDVTATLGAGIRGYRPIGSEVTFAFHALPEYVWWSELDERSTVAGRYGAGLFGDLGRTGFELSYSRAEQQGFFTRELNDQVIIQTDTANADVEVELVGGLAAFAGAQLVRYRFPETEGINEDILPLERDEEILRAGFRFFLGPLKVGLGVEDVQVDFEPSLVDRSNSGPSPILELDLDGKRSGFTLQLADRDLEGEPGSVFPAYDEITGSTALTFSPTGRSQLQLLGRRNLVYAVQEGQAYFEDTYTGLALRLSLGGNSALQLFGGTGTNDFVEAVTGATTRSDDYEQYGAQLRFALRAVTLTVGANVVEFDSNQPGQDRRVTLIQSGISFGRGAGGPWG